MKPRPVCLVAGGMSAANLRLQPWRYLYEVARGLARQGHEVLLVSDQDLRQPAVEKLRISRLPSTRNFRWRSNPGLLRLIMDQQPEVILQHVGLSSFLHQNCDMVPEVATIGIFTSPIYRLKELRQLGYPRLARSLQLDWLHLASSLIPRGILATRIEYCSLRSLVVETETTCWQLHSLGVRAKPLAVIPPGVDPVWRDPWPGRLNGAGVRLNGDQVVFCYFGPAEELRGFHTLLAAFAQAVHQDPGLRLEAWVRAGWEGSPSYKWSGCLNHSTEPLVRIEHRPLSPGELAARVAWADVVVLPFEMVPSDAPLSVMEAAALGKPLVTTPVACLPELAARVPHFFSRPGDAASLCAALLAVAAHVREARVGAQAWEVPVGVDVRSWQQVGEEWSRLVQSL